MSQLRLFDAYILVNIYVLTVFPEWVQIGTLKDVGLSISYVYRVYWFSIYSGHFGYIIMVDGD